MTAPMSPAEIRAYVNEQGVTLPPGSTALDAIRAAVPEHASRITEGTMRITDSRGLPLDPATPAHGGMILRTVPVRATTEPAS